MKETKIYCIYKTTRMEYPAIVEVYEEPFYFGENTTKSVKRVRILKTSNVYRGGSTLAFTSIYHIMDIDESQKDIDVIDIIPEYFL